MYTLIAEKSFSKIITINNSENTPIEVDINPNIEITPGEMLGFIFRDFVTSNKNALRNSRILHSWLSHISCIVLQMMMDNASPYTEIFISKLMHGFLEISEQSQNMAIIFQPLRRHSWYWLIIRCDNRPLRFSENLRRSASISYSLHSLCIYIFP